MWRGSGSVRVKAIGGFPARCLPCWQERDGHGLVADWRAEVVHAVDQLSGSTDSAGHNGWYLLGAARPAADPQRLQVDLRAGAIGPDSLDGLVLSTEQGPDTTPLFTVEGSMFADGMLSFPAPAAASAGYRHVWTRRLTPPHAMLDRLRDLAAGAGHLGLADRFARAELDGEPDPGPAPPELTADQAMAFRACVQPGLRLVWGPPGTGKTLVLGKAIEHLVANGQRVLLVSTTSAAVDDAVLAAVRAIRPQPGVVVRVGTPHAAELAGDDRVRLDQLAARPAGKLVNRLKAVERRLAELDASRAELATLDRKLRNYHPAIHRVAAARLRQATKLATLERSRQAFLAQRGQGVQRLSPAASETRQARHDWDAVQVQRRLLRQADELRRQLDEADQEVRRLRTEVADAEAAVTATLHTRRGWFGSARRAEQRSIRRRAASARAALYEQEAELARLGAAHEPAIRQARRAAAPVTDAEVEHRRQRLAEAEATERRLRNDVEATAVRLAELDADIDRLRSRWLPTERDHALVADAERLGLPARYRRRAELRVQTAASADTRQELQRQLHQLHDQAERQRGDAERAVLDRAGVVATTLARAPVTPAVADQRFDVVLVDGAGAAMLPEVLLALTQADRTAVLLGDIMQLGPQPVRPARSSTDPAVRRWLHTGVFEHCGVRSPYDALDRPGCVTLRHQFRFGPALRRLANEAGYQVLADGAELATDIVLVDPSGLPDLAVVRRDPAGGAWWTAGAMLAGALAAHHAGRGETVGIATPYRAQRDATLAAVRDAEASTAPGPVPPAAVGTVPALQGREFDVVVLDLVEDGRGQVARSRDGRDGARLMGAGGTGARRRLYLVADAVAILAATAGPLAAVREGVDRGDIDVVSAAGVLGVDREHGYWPELERRLRAARSSVWMLAPWVSRRWEQLVALLAGAVRRGVRVNAVLRPDAPADALPDVGVTVVRADLEHRKVVIIDEETVLLGSLDIHFGGHDQHGHPPGGSREIIVTRTGRHYARRLLTDLGAELAGGRSGPAGPTFRGCRAPGPAELSSGRDTQRRQTRVGST